jgi:hypothetical protein
MNLNRYSNDYSCQHAYTGDVTLSVGMILEIEPGLVSISSKKCFKHIMRCLCAIAPLN